MTYQIEYTGRSGDVQPSEIEPIVNSVLSWADGDAKLLPKRANYDFVNEELLFVVSVVEVTDIGTRIDSMDTSIESINTDHNTAFELASESAAIGPYNA
jgi:hypothetical protein